MTAFYNEHDPKAAAWLRELIRRNLIAPGEVDERSIVDVRPSDLRGFAQCHFFAGIGTWSYALRQAGWPDDRPVWTGSPPCQPFSVAGKGDGGGDERHLAPVWLQLVKECRPPVLFGEQVEAAVGHGWWDDLHARLEAEDYACGMVVLGAHSAGAPHIRQRIFFVGHTIGSGLEGRGVSGAIGAGDGDGEGIAGKASGGFGLIGHSLLPGREALHGEPLGGAARPKESPHPGAHRSFWSDAVWLPCRDGKWRPTGPGIHPLVGSEATGKLSLNSSLSRWLMGLPKEWCECAISAHRMMKEKKDEKAKVRHQARSAKALRGVRGDPASSEVQRSSRVDELLPPASLLQPPVHGGSDDQGGLRESKPQSDQSPSVGSGALCQMRGRVSDSCSPLGREPTEQRSSQPDASLPELPFDGPLTVLRHGDGETCPLPALRQAFCENRPMQHAPDETGEVRRSAVDQEADRPRELGSREGVGRGGGAPGAPQAGWPTPNCCDTIGPRSAEALARAKKIGGCSNLKDVAPLASWPTPRALDTIAPRTPEEWERVNAEKKASNPNLGGLHKPLGVVAALASWPTPRSEDSESSGARVSRGTADTLTAVSRLALGYDPNASAEARTMRLKGYGNGITAPVAIEFIRAFMDVAP